jgi:hypothetical protein
MASHLSTLRSRVERALLGRVAAPFTLRRPLIENASTGIAEVDALVGGLPRGALTELFGPPCSGCTSFLFSAVSARTIHAEACALVDGFDAFDPRSAKLAGVDLKQLLWVRCRTIEQSFRATDFLLQAGGFGFIALDLSDFPRELVRRVPLDTWFRFRRAVEGTQTILLVLEQEPNAKTCASLVLRMKVERCRWREMLRMRVEDSCRHPFSRLFDGSDVRAELIRSRNHQGVKIDFQGGEDWRMRDNKSIIFQTTENCTF